MEQRPSSPWRYNRPLTAFNDLLPKLVDNLQAYLTITPSESEGFNLQRHKRTGRCLGDLGLVEQLKKYLNRILKPQKRGQKGPWKHKKTKGGKS